MYKTHELWLTRGMFLLISFHFNIYRFCMLLVGWLTNKIQQHKAQSNYIWNFCLVCENFDSKKSNLIVFTAADQPRNQVPLNRCQPQSQYPLAQHQPVQKNFSNSFVEFLNSNTTYNHPRNTKTQIQQGTDSSKAIPNFVTAADASRLQ